MGNMSQLEFDTLNPNGSLTDKAVHCQTKQPWGLNMLDEIGHPFSPMGGLVRVRPEYRATVATAYGEQYVCSKLALRERRGEQRLYAPVAIGPGNIACFTWPAAAMDTEWIEVAEG